MTTEIWLPIDGWEGLYEVSNVGRVRSLPRKVRGGNGSHAIRGGRILKNAVTGDYEHVSLHDVPRKSNARIHVLVAKAFLGPKPSADMNACHWNGNSRDNSATNLYWGTQLQNIQDKVRHGTDRYALKRGHCQHGHTYDEANTYLNANGSPLCRRCRAEGMRKRTRGKDD